RRLLPEAIQSADTASLLGLVGLACSNSLPDSANIECDPLRQLQANLLLVPLSRIAEARLCSCRQRILARPGRAISASPPLRVVSPLNRLSSAEGRLPLPSHLHSREPEQETHRTI